MPKMPPKVLDGTRGPRSERLDDMRADAETPFEAAQPHIPVVDGTVYLSMFPSYCVQVTAPADVTDPITGRKTIGRPTKALFQEGRYVNNARDKKLRTHIDEILQSNSRFGKPGSGADYWLADEARRMAQAAAKLSAASTLRQLAQNNPDELAALLAELKQGDDTDVKMPAPPAAPAA